LNAFSEISIFRRICLLDLGFQDICNWRGQLRLLEFRWALSDVLLVLNIGEAGVVSLDKAVSVNAVSFFAQY